MGQAHQTTAQPDGAHQMLLITENTKWFPISTSLANKKGGEGLREKFLFLAPNQQSKQECPSCFDPIWAERDGHAGVDVITTALWRGWAGLAVSLAQMLLHNSTLKIKALLFSVGFQPPGAALAAGSWADARWCRVQEVKPDLSCKQHL